MKDRPRFFLPGPTLSRVAHARAALPSISAKPARASHRLSLNTRVRSTRSSLFKSSLVCPGGSGTLPLVIEAHLTVLITVFIKECASLNGAARMVGTS
jgi:hypothetical protein